MGLLLGSGGHKPCQRDNLSGPQAAVHTDTLKEPHMAGALGTEYLVAKRKCKLVGAATASEASFMSVDAASKDLMGSQQWQHQHQCQAALAGVVAIVASVPWCLLGRLNLYRD